VTWGGTGMPGFSSGSGTGAGLEREGEDPGPIGQVVILVLVLGVAGADLGRHLVQGRASTAVAASSLRSPGRTSLERPGTMCSTSAAKAASFSSGSVIMRVRPMTITDR
jgi:hypothetical protein